MIGAIMLELGLFAVSTGIRYWPRDPKQPPPSSVSGVPRTDEGAPLPLIYGRCLVRAPVVAWIGNWNVNFSSSNSIGYGVDMLFIVGVPFYGGMADLIFIYAGDFQLVVQPTANPDPMERPGRRRLASINGVTVFGGENGSGGIKGSLEFFDGRPTQQLSDYIAHEDQNDDFTILQQRQTMRRWSPPNEHIVDPEQIDETLMPGYRNQAVCLFYNWSIGRVANFTSYAFDVVSKSLGTASDMGVGEWLSMEDADPTAVIYDLLTSPWGKLGFPASKIDRDSFVAASRTLLRERHGYSRAIEQAEDASTIVADILRQVDGVLYEEPTTGLLVLKLIRNDYGDVTQLQNINPDNARPPDEDWYQVQGWSETLNQVRVTFTDRNNNYKDGLAVAQNGANAAGQDERGLRSADLKFVGCCEVQLAQRLVARELAVLSNPMVTATIQVNRSFHRARPGSVYTLTWPELGIDRMVMRVVRVDLGELHKGAITLDLIRDIFDITKGALGFQPGSGAS